VIQWKLADGSEAEGPTDEIEWHDLIADATSPALRVVLAWDEKVLGWRVVSADQLRDDTGFGLGEVSPFDFRAEVGRVLRSAGKPVVD
jgi:hypothetical protein